jgi:hypothetical protein
MRARHGALMAAAIFSGTGCVGIWSVMEMMGDGSHAGGLALPLFVLSIAGLFWGASRLREAFRDARLSRNESRWEWERGIRPRI